MSNEESIEFRAKILKWYDYHRRVLPWRALPQEDPDPYRVWLSEIMLQQTTVPAVIPYFLKFTKRWPSVQALAKADTQEIMSAWAGLGYYARARNLHKCAKSIVSNYDGVFPQDQQALKKLPGIGDYTSAAIASIAFNHPATVVDGNVERIMARYYAVIAPLPAAKKKLALLAHALSKGQGDRPGDYAQGLMDLGATICTPKSPTCSLCPLLGDCKAHDKGLSTVLPKRQKKVAKPQKVGFVYLITNSCGDLLIHKRPENGLLGGMYGLPTSDWVLEKEYEALTHPDFVEAGSVVSFPENSLVQHSFTHFDLRLKLFHCALPEKRSVPDVFYWYNDNDLKTLSLPTVFKKAYRLFH